MAVILTTSPASKTPERTVLPEPSVTSKATGAVTAISARFKDARPSRPTTLTADEIFLSDEASSGLAGLLRSWLWGHHWLHVGRTGWGQHRLILAIWCRWIDINGGDFFDWIHLIVMSHALR